MLAHQQLGLAIARSLARKPDAGIKPTVDFDKLYSLEFSGPAINLLQALCQAAGAKLVVADLDPALTATRIKLNVKDQPLSAILKAAAAQIECTVTLDADQAIIKKS